MVVGGGNIREDVWWRSGWKCGGIVGGGDMAGEKGIVGESLCYVGKEVCLSNDCHKVGGTNCCDICW